MQPNFEVRPHFHEGRNGFASGTFWKHPQWGIYLTALHVHAMQNRTPPPFITRNPDVAEGIIDAVVYGGISPTAEAPRLPILGETCFCYGVPEQSVAVQRRVAKVYHQRTRVEDGADYSTPNWIAEIAELPTPIESFNSEAGLEYDNDGDIDQFFEFVSMLDIFNIFAPNGSLVA